MATQRWQVRLSAYAQLDFDSIIAHTAKNFGTVQARLYRDTLIQAIAELGGGPEPLGSKRRDEIALGSRTLHVARHGRRGRHFLLYRVAGENVIEIGRILHDAMELKQHRLWRQV